MARSVHSGPAQVFPSAGGTPPFDHYGFPCWVQCANGDIYMIVMAGTSHIAMDTHLVGKRCLAGSDPGLTASWGSEEVLSINASSVYCDRPGGAMRKLASGRVVYGWQRPLISGGWSSPGRQQTPWSAYSDDNCVTWSTPVLVDHLHYPTLACPSDFVQLPNGDVLMVIYGCRTNDVSDPWDVSLSISHDECETWDAYAMVLNDGTIWSEPMAVLLNSGQILMTVADVDAYPQPQYKLFSTNAGHTTWTSPVMVVADSVNRQALSRTTDGTIVLAGGRGGSHYYNESTDEGGTFGSAQPVGTNQSPFFGPTWTSPERMGVAGVTPSLGIAWSNEGSGQAAAETYFTTFTALPVPGITSPDAADITETTAMIVGNVNPNGHATTYRVEYGPTTSYGTNTTWTSAGSGSSPVAVEVPLSGLTPGTLYHARLVAQSSEGTTNGPDIPFTTDALPPPDVGLTLDESSIWTHTGTQVTARALTGRRSTVMATAYSENGGPIWGDGPEVALFDIDGEPVDGQTTIILDPGVPARVELGVTPVDAGPLSIRIGVPE